MLRIYRARESRASAEAELLSSTSDSVCELWSGQEVVRAFGEPKMKEIIVRTNPHGNISVNSLAQALEKGHYELTRDKTQLWRRRKLVQTSRVEDDDKNGLVEAAAETAQLLENRAPNITLNVKGSIAP